MRRRDYAAVALLAALLFGTSSSALFFWVSIVLPVSLVAWVGWTIASGPPSLRHMHLMDEAQHLIHWYKD